ncbi:hypothetical protein T05_5411 [Trichinella murrelli]|uniref:Uncharacterized protein n=1 Tax=Trichinella murrelli TaxID=144512 RepID=A0A0V0U2D3_9BILA|nr:hypothetical protein T05_5411 [Trichinella murrelli]
MDSSFNNGIFSLLSDIVATKLFLSSTETADCSDWLIKKSRQPFTQFGMLRDEFLPKIAKNSIL